MLNQPNLFRLSLFCGLLASCTTQSGKVDLPITEKEFSKPKVVYINPDSLTVITPGENGVPLPKTVRAGKPKVVPNRLRPILAGDPTIVKIDTTKLIAITPGENGVPLPKTYTIPDSGYLVQHGDTIWAPKIVTASHPEPVKALPPRYKSNAVYDIQYFDLDQGMLSSYILSMLEDQEGSFWFGTVDGLSRYDGTSFTEIEGLPNSSVLSILEDKSGNLWFGTFSRGVSRYDGTSFTSFNQSEGLVNKMVRSILEDKSGNLWFGTEGGVSRYDGTSFTSFTVREGLAGNSISSILEDKSGNLWFGTEGGVSRYDGTSFTSFTENEGLVNNSVRSILEDKNGNLWFGTDDGGVSRYEGNSFTTFSESTGLINNRVRSILEDKNGNLWFGTDVGGVSRYDGTSFTSFTENEGLINNRVMSILEDKSGNLWFGTWGGGVSRYNETSFTSFTEHEGLANNNVFPILEDKSGNLWFGTYEGGVSRYDGTSFTSFTKIEGLVGNRISSILEDKSGNLWLGTEGGVSRYDGTSFTSFTKIEGLVGNSISSILEDKSGNLWFGTEGGVSHYDGTSFTFFTERDGLANNHVYSILEDRSGNLWFGTRGGVSHYDGTSFTSFTEREGLVNNSVYSMLEDKSGNLWFGTYGGLSVLTNRELKKENQLVFQTFTTEHGLPHDKVLSFIQDNMNRLWIGTEGGILLLNDPTKMNWEPADYQVFIELDGLKGLDVAQNSVCLDSHNQIWWGMGKGLNMLDLNAFEPPKGIPSIQLNGVDINGTFVDYNILKDSLQVGQEYRIGKEQRTSLSEVVFSSVHRFRNYPENLFLPYDLNHLTFRYSAIEWEAPHKLQYQYMLEGLDENWNDITKETKAEYRNLPHGDFTFKVKAKGASHKWCETFAYPFTIRPPWWLTWWAKTLWIGSVFVFFLTIYKFRTHSLKTQKRKLQIQVDEQTIDLKKKSNHLIQANEELNATNEELNATNEELNASNENLNLANKKLKDLDEHKESMTAMLVHDFKNSLNTVINFSDDTPTPRRTKGINQAGKFMLNMVLNMLDVQKFETTSIKLSTAVYPISKVVNTSIDQLGYLIDQKSIKLTYLQQEDIICNIDFELIVRCIVNILSNAIKFVPSNGKIDISVNQKEDVVVLSVKDNGPGIPADRIDNVFDKFSQINVKKSGSVRSTGIGLTFCKMVVEVHKGTIGVESTEGEGSNFYFTLPIIENSEVQESTLEKTVVIEEPKFVLSDKEMKLLEPYIEKLQKWEVFDYSEVSEIVEKIKSKHANILLWKENLMQALQKGNEELFNEILNR